MAWAASVALHAVERPPQRAQQHVANSTAHRTVRNTEHIAQCTAPWLARASALWLPGHAFLNGAASAVAPLDKLAPWGTERCSAGVPRGHIRA